MTEILLKGLKSRHTNISLASLWAAPLPTIGNGTEDGANAATQRTECVEVENRLRAMAACSKDQGPVVQSIVSFTSSLRGQLIKCFTTL